MGACKLELGHIQTQMTQKPVLRVEVGARAVAQSGGGMGHWESGKFSRVFEKVHHFRNRPPPLAASMSPAVIRGCLCVIYLGPVYRPAYVDGPSTPLHAASIASHTCLVHKSWTCFVVCDLNSSCMAQKYSL